MEEVVIRYSNFAALKNRLNALGLSYKDGEDENGNQYRTEEFLGLVSTPHLEDINGFKYFTTRLADGDASKMPNNDHNPAFVILWRESELDESDPENPVPYPWPEVEVQAYDENGDPAGTRMQGVGRIVR